ncbi:MAG: glycosyltransferase [Phycisphaerae bacterium]
MNILLAMPTTHRWAAAVARLMRWHELASGRHAIEYQVTADETERAEALAARDQLAAGGLNVRVALCPPRGKIHACNFGIPTAPAWDILLLASDDFAPLLAGWDDCVAGAMAWHFPAFDGVLHFHDGYLGAGRLITLPVIGFHYYRRFGYVYHPDYQSLFCDNELTEVSRRIHKYAWIHLVLARHEHGGPQGDAVYIANQRHHAADQLLFQRRRAAGFGVRVPDISILTPTLYCRQPLAQTLLMNLYAQVWALPDPHRVEILTSLDQQEQPVGCKRNELLGKARGRYVCFIDDDDRVAEDYLSSLLAAIDAAPGADCVVFRGQYYVDGRPGLEFDFDLAYTAYRNTAERYERTPNHLCPVRRTCALQARFDPANRGEDHAYARRLRQLLRTQAVCRDASGHKKLLYHYQFSPAGTMTQK